MTAARFMSARRADLAGVVLAPAAVPEQHQARIFSARRVHRGDVVPSPAMRAVQFVARMEWRVVGGEVPHTHTRIFRAALDGVGQRLRSPRSPRPFFTRVRAFRGDPARANG